MNNPFDHIEAFVSGSLSAEEVQSFKEEMAKDAALREEVELVREMELFALRKVENKGALDVVSEVMREGKVEEEGGRAIEGEMKRRSFLRTTLYFVAAALVALLVWVVLPKGGGPLSSEELFVEYFTVPAMSITKKGAPQDSLLQVAQRLFNAKQFEESLVIFSELERSDESDLYRAINLQMVDQPKNSLDILLSKSNKSNDTYWYIAMAYLKLGDSTSAKTWLLKIDKNSVHYTKSQALFKQL